MNITGTGIALVTPFNIDGAVDYNSLEKIVNHVIDGGVDYLVALGTTAESATLNFEEQQSVLNAVVKYSNNKVPVVIGIGGNNTSLIIEKLNSFSLDGVHAILSVSPYYNRPSQKGIYEHYKIIAESSPLPLILYNVPGRTASNIESSTTLKLAEEFDNIIGIKEASGNLEQCMEIIKNKPDNFSLTSGDDVLALPLTLLGGVGVISVIGQAYPLDFSNMIRNALNQDVLNATKKHYQLLEIIKGIFIDGNPSGIKYLLSELGLCNNQVRLPLVSVNNKTKSIIKQNML